MENKTLKQRLDSLAQEQLIKYRKYLANIFCICSSVAGVPNLVVTFFGDSVFGCLYDTKRWLLSNLSSNGDAICAEDLQRLAV